MKLRLIWMKQVAIAIAALASGCATAHLPIAELTAVQGICRQSRPILKTSENSVVGPGSTLLGPSFRFFLTSDGDCASATMDKLTVAPSLDDYIAATALFESTIERVRSKDPDLHILCGDKACDAAAASEIANLKATDIDTIESFFCFRIREIGCYYFVMGHQGRIRSTALRLEIPKGGAQHLGEFDYVRR